MPEESEVLVNAGLRSVQREYRISIRDVCGDLGIEEGDIVEVFLRTTPYESRKIQSNRNKRNMTKIG